MTREEAKVAANIMLAYANGKDIEVMHNRVYTVCSDPSFNWENKLGRYRVKPEPIYRAFKNKEECWNEMQRHEPFGWVINGGVYFLILSIYGNAFYTQDQDEIYYDDALKNFTFADGKPFGIKEE